VSIGGNAIEACLPLAAEFLRLAWFAGFSAQPRVSASAVLVDSNSKSVSLNLSLSFVRPIGMH